MVLGKICCSHMWQREQSKEEWCKMHWTIMLGYGTSGAISYSLVGFFNL
jgi:hypothetical protein